MQTSKHSKKICIVRCNVKFTLLQKVWKCTLRIVIEHIILRPRSVPCDVPKSLLLCHLNNSNTWLVHPIRMQRKSNFVRDRHGQWGHACATAALQRLWRRRSLRDGFRGCEVAPSWQSDASETHLHTFHPSTAWPGHVGITTKSRGSVAVWGAHSYSRWHLIFTWVTSYAHITCPPESQKSLEPHPGCLKVIWTLF